MSDPTLSQTGDPLTPAALLNAAADLIDARGLAAATVEGTVPA